MKVSEIGEFGLIDRLDKMIAAAGVDRFSPDLLIGIGDDTAAWKTSGKIQLATVDSMVESIHFKTDTASWQETGWKALAINISDIAAMGGVPRYALINLALPPNTEDVAVFQLYEGIIACAKAFETAIVGGNVSSAAQVSITVTIIGESLDSKILKRSEAKAGDIIAVTGWPGSAAGGLAMLLQKLKLDEESSQYFRHAFLHPTPRVKEGGILVNNGIAAAIDTSDGLISDLRHICEASKVSARINTADLPLHDLLVKNFKTKAVEMALTGGEDYQLLFTGKAESVKKAVKQLEIPAHIIGEITRGEPGKIEVVGSDGKPMDLKKTGWTHF